MAERAPRLSLRLAARTLDLVEERKVRVRILRTDNTGADHALARRLIAADAIVEAAARLLQDGVRDGFGTFTYDAPPRAGADALATLQRFVKEAGVG